MADYNSNYTGAEVDAAIAKTQELESAANINEAIKPNAANAGDVWTADGNGAAAWVTPSGGSSLYLHKIQLLVHANTSNTAAMYITMITPDADAYTSTNIVDKINTYLANNNYKFLNAFCATSNPNVFGIGTIKADTASNSLKYGTWLCDLPNTPTVFNSSSTQHPTFSADQVQAL